VKAAVGGYEAEEPRSWRHVGDGGAGGGGERFELRWGFFIDTYLVQDGQ
jgi:hypothetical protein